MSYCIKNTDNQQWWFANVKNRVAGIYNNESMADVHFLVGNSGDMQKIPAHKFVLAVGSSVFEAMFYGSLPEKDEIEIPDVDPLGFLNLLQFLYCCDEIKLNDDNVLSTLYAAKKYQVEHVVTICLNYVEINLNGGNAWLFLNNLKLFDEINFVQKCWETIIIDTKSALKAEDFTLINKETLQKLLNREKLNCAEADIFKAVIKWVDANHSYEESITNNEKNILGDLKYLIRIPTMTLKEFTNIVVNSGLLSQEEIITIFMYYAADEKKPDLNYSTTPRTKLEPQLRQLWIYFSPRLWISSINIKVKNSVFIIGLKYNLSSTIKIENLNSRVKVRKLDCVVAKKDFTINYVNNINQFKVCFKHPICFQPNTYYTISIKLVGSTSELDFECVDDYEDYKDDDNFQCRPLITSDMFCTVDLIYYNKCNI